MHFINMHFMINLFSRDIYEPNQHKTYNHINWINKLHTSDVFIK